LRSRGREGRHEVAQIRWRGRKGPGFAPRPACLRRRIGRKGGGGLGPHATQIHWRGRRGLGSPRTWRATTATTLEEREEGAAARSGGRGVREGGRDGGRGGMRCAIEGEEMGGGRLTGEWARV